jgi:hypothetical protein
MIRSAAGSPERATLESPGAHHDGTDQMMQSERLAGATLSGAGPFSCILVAVDASPAAEASIQLAISMARAHHGVELIFCHVIDVYKMLVRADKQFEDFTVMRSVAHEKARAMLDRAGALAVDGGIFSRSYIREGAPAEEIAALGQDPKKPCT